MDNDIEGIGEAVTGALAARAVEPAHGEGGSEGERLCANCSTVLIGTHCHLCGQKAHIHRSIGAIGHDLMHGVLHLDGKFWRTMPLLILRPGELTRRFVDGERAKFVSPLGMFLFAIFLMFAVFQIYGVSLSNIDVDSVSTELAQEEFENQIANVREERARLDRELAVLESQPDRQADADALRTRLENFDGRIEELDIGQRHLDTVISSTTGENVGPVDGNGNPTGTNDLRNLSTGWDRLDYGIEKIRENPSLALYKLQANGYKFSWLLIPLSVPFVWILFFWTRRFRMYDHAVFVTYSLAFMSLFAVVLTVLGFMGLGGGWIVGAVSIIPLLHMYKQLKYGYRLTRLGALIRTALLANFCFITASIFFVMLLGIGALG
ncbi:DUF3667 domain-containing protein [Parasphingopyxis marina]|uniref:DUF3667 domain-containing protein n=1 Tax=Parasphingopyxis marina TaxID=2761622 RepID=A0A842I3P6_9SPHN|nr:DUF3667 domain-containing protein [Parasphingopyxis marina]MBC2778674.1 DUF3667 domain-containing protein [Parasphingopyxis marina]